MSDFKDLRNQLSAQRAARQAAERRLSEDREQLKKVVRTLAALRRRARPNEAPPPERDGLEERAIELAAAIESGRDDLERLGRLLGDLKLDLARLGDPRALIEQWSDAVPILLLPVRLETRFKTLGSGDAARHELWVRFYPDACSVDAFEAGLSEREVESATSFWAEYFAAGGFEAQRRAAFRALSASHGSGRATYLLEQVRPENPEDEPVKARPEDIVLVVVADHPLVAVEQTAIFTYWVAVYRAGGSPALEAEALQTLVRALGSARALEVNESLRPRNLGKDPPAPHRRQDVEVVCAILVIAPDHAERAKTAPWTEPARAALLPDRFVVVAERAGAAPRVAVGNPVAESLAVGPDPSLPSGSQIELFDGDLVLNDELRWLADFDEAVATGMGLRLPLNADETSEGFDRLFVLGLRSSSDERESAIRLSELFRHHQLSRRGLGLVPQGSATNNTEGESTDYSWVDDPDAAFDRLFPSENPVAGDAPDPSDAGRLAAALGISPAVLATIPRADATDFAEARAMNTALWPATFGYFMESLLTPVFTPLDIENTRQFFLDFVSGRGPLPALRVGRQPYGLLPVTALSRFEPGRQHPLSGYLSRLHALVMRLDREWETMASSAAHVQRPGDPPQVLLDVLGLHPGSVEYHQRWAEGLQELYNRLNLALGPFLAAIVAAAARERGVQTLARFGYTDSELPQIAEKFFFLSATPLGDEPVVDDVPLSERDPVRPYAADGKNYIEWLATSSFDAVRRQDFGGKPLPLAKLYVLLRHALMLSYWDAGIRFIESSEPEAAIGLRKEAPFIHVDPAAVSASKFQPLYSPAPRVTGEQRTPLIDYVGRAAILGAAKQTFFLREVLNALEQLSKLPTARLERAFAEHIDTASYRLDAWKTGLSALRLSELRAAKNQEGLPKGGIFLGAYGWLEDLRPRPDNLTSVPLGKELAAVFEREQDAPLRSDPENFGHLHAPSLDHAATAAILNNAFRVHADPEMPEFAAVNLSSERVRRALGVLEGMRNGQSLSALLGYRFERGLHDAHDIAEVDKFIYPLRKVFPLVADKLRDTASEEDVDIRLVEARNVLDAVALLEHIRASGVASYPFGKPTGDRPGQLPNATDPELRAINAEVERLRDVHDALSDLVLSESIYQTVRGNFERAGGALKTLSQAHHPPEMEVALTPRSGKTLVHRVALHLDATVDVTASPNAVSMTPRARALAPLNHWLNTLLPSPELVGCRVGYTTPALASEQSVTVTQADLGLQPIDLLFLANTELDHAADRSTAELDSRIARFVRYEVAKHPGTRVTIAYTEPVSGIPLFEVAAVVRSLRAIVLKARPLSLADLVLPAAAERRGAPAVDTTEVEARARNAVDGLTALLPRFANVAALSDSLDDYTREATALLLDLARFGVPLTETESVHNALRGSVERLHDKARQVSERWKAKATAFETKLSRYSSLATDEQRLELLREVEGLVSSARTPEPPNDVDLYRADVEAKKVVFDAALEDFRNFPALDVPGLSDVFAAADSLAVRATELDAVPFNAEDEKSAAELARAELQARLEELEKTVTSRRDDAQALLDGIASTPAGERPALLERAMRFALGDEMRVLPRFILPERDASEFSNAFDASADLVSHLTASHPFPVDDWLYGVARVRQKLEHWENVTLLAEAFERPAPALTPLQLPYQEADRWLALEFPEDYTHEGERVLYTAHFAAPFDATKPQLGLLVDEWTELVPGDRETTGVAFHFDQPNHEPPQALLLAVPPVRRGAWRWDDLLAIVSETFDEAKKRAVEPAQIDAGALAQFLPAVLAAVTLHPITIMANFAANPAPATQGDG